MKSFQLLIFAGLFGAAVLGCSSSNRYNIPGRQCPANYKPVDFDARIKQKTWQKGDNESGIPAGTYSYQTADLIYTENGDKGAIVHIKDLADKGGFKASVFCARNAINLSEKNLSAISTAASKMIAKAGEATDVEAKEISFRVQDRRLVVESKPLPKPANLEKAYEGKASEFFLVENFNNKVDYEVISRYSDNTGSYVLSVKFKRAD